QSRAWATRGLSLQSRRLLRRLKSSGSPVRAASLSRTVGSPSAERLRGTEFLPKQEPPLCGKTTTLLSILLPETTTSSSLTPQPPMESSGQYDWGQWGLTSLVSSWGKPPLQVRRPPGLARHVEMVPAQEGRERSWEESGAGPYSAPRAGKGRK
ncbi:unnamed protein product, partial [Gulo gulo]